MKILSCALVLMACLAFVMLGCSDNSNSLVTPNEQTLATAAPPGSLGKGGVLNSATGSGHWRSVPVTGETNWRVSFSAVRHADGTVSGEVETRDAGNVMFGKARVYGLKVSGNMAKLDFQFIHGNFNSFYPPEVKITDIHGWMIVEDNGEGAHATEPDLVSLILFTDGSDVPPFTIPLLDSMGPEEYLEAVGAWLLENYGIEYEDFVSPYDHGSVQVR